MTLRDAIGWLLSWRRCAICRRPFRSQTETELVCPRCMPRRHEWIKAQIMNRAIEEDD